MDKYEFKIKVDQIKKLVERGDYETAMKIADTIDWHRVRNASLLSMAAQVYEKNEEYQEAKDILLLAFERAPIGKRLLYKLADLALKDGSVAEAEAYYREFCDLAQDDPRQYLLRYQILKAKQAPTGQLIRALETYTSIEVDEKWLYELAELYHEAGRGRECVTTCDKIMLLFGLGKYVDKAMDLKLEYEPLSKYQMDLVENRDKYEAKLRAVEDDYNAGYSVQADYEENPVPQRKAAVSQDDIEKEVVIRIHEDEQTQKLAEEMSKIADEGTHVIVEEDNEMDATRTLDDIHMIKEIKPTQRVLDAAAEREAEEKAEREIERQRNLIRAAKVREEEEQEALRRAEEEREEARRAEEERRARRQAEIDRERIRNERERYIAANEDESEKNNLMIEAGNAEDGVAAAVEELKKLHKKLGTKNPVAKISSDKLNRKGISAVAAKLAGKDLVIENAAGLTDALQNELDELMEKDKSGMIVVLIDTKKQLKEIRDRNASLASKFRYVEEDTEATARRKAQAELEQALKKETETQEKISRDVIQVVEKSEEPEKEPEKPKAEPAPIAKVPEPVEEGSEDEYEEEEEYEDEYEEYRGSEEESSDEIPAEEYNDPREMDLEEFAQYACRYAADIDCSITGKSLLALYERIEMMEEDGVHLTKKAAIDLIENAADKAEKPSIGRKLTGLFSPKYDKEGLLILHENDFFD